MKHILIFLWLLAVQASAAKQPNILFILTDDQGYGDVGRHGHPLLKTPHHDALHDQSVRFQNFYVSPSCSPTRAALMTGMHEFRSGVTHTTEPREHLDLNAVIGWAVYGASVALVTPYGALGAVSSRQTVVFGIRLADTVIGLAGVIVLLAVGGASDLAPYVLAVSSALGGLALRFVAARDARGEGGEDVTTALP